MVKMAKLAPQLTIVFAICIALFIGLAGLFFPRKIQQIGVHWGGYTLLGRSKSLVEYMKTDGYIRYLRCMGVIFIVWGALTLAAALKGGLFSR